MSFRYSFLHAAVRKKIGRWLVVLGEFAISQGLGQAAGMLVGLIYVRMMPTDQYAVYALCMATLAMVSVGSDLGLTGSLSYFWRQSLQERGAIGPKIAAVRRMRTALFAAALVVGGFSFFTSTRSNPISSAALIFCFVLVAWIAFLQMHSSVEIMITRLEGRQRLTYYCEIAGTGARLAVAVAMLLTGILTAWFGLMGGLMGAAVTWAGIRFIGRQKPQLDHKIDSADWRDIRGYLLPLFPSVAVFMVQEPLVLWLAATRTGPTAVAEVFALGRISAIYGLIGGFSNIVMIPVLSRITDDRRFMKISVQYIVVLSILSILVLAVTWLFPELPLFLIGNKYSHLHGELLISMLTSIIMVLASFFILAVRLRGWVKLDTYFALWQLMAIFSLCALWKFDTTMQIVGLNLAISISSLICAIATFGIGLVRPAMVSIQR